MRVNGNMAWIGAEDVETAARGMANTDTFNAFTTCTALLFDSCSLIRWTPQHCGSGLMQVYICFSTHAFAL